jgi:Flp pilus assembly pilin Flp
MFRLLKTKKGQSTLEYAILVVVIIMALIAIQAYLKRGIQGRMRDSADQIGEQFSPEDTTYNFVTKSYTKTNETQDAWTTTTKYEDSWQERSGSEIIGNFESEYGQQQQ